MGIFKSINKKLAERNARLYNASLEKNRVRININDLSNNDLLKIKRLHQTQLLILDEFVRICNKHNLAYFLYGGTLLGAVRHGGFIPWDDDVDIAMSRADFDRLGELVSSELDKRYFYQTCYTDNNFPWCFAKIRMNNTYVDEPKKRNLDIHKGIFIDIMPLDVFPQNERQGLKMLERLIWLNNVHARDKIIAFNPYRRLVHKIYKRLPKRIVYNRVKKLIAAMHDDQSNKVCSISSHYRPLQKLVFNKEWFAGSVSLPFEDREYNTFTGWKEYLTYVYGEYMQPPPPEGMVMKHFDSRGVKFDESEFVHGN